MTKRAAAVAANKALTGKARATSSAKDPSESSDLSDIDDEPQTDKQDEEPDYEVEIDEELAMEDEEFDVPSSDSDSDFESGPSKKKAKRGRASNASSNAAAGPSTVRLRQLDKLAKEKEDPKFIPSSTDKLSTLSNEILIEIFCHLERPSAFALVNKRFHALAVDSYCVSRYLMEWHGKDCSLFHLIGYARLCTPETIDRLMQSGALCSRYLLQTVLDAYADVAPAWIARDHSYQWACQNRLPFLSYHHLLSIGAKLYGNKMYERGEDNDGFRIGEIFRDTQVMFGGLDQEAIDAGIKPLTELIEIYNFRFFSPSDPGRVDLLEPMLYDDRVFKLGRKAGIKVSSHLIWSMMENKVDFSNSYVDVLEEMQKMQQLDPNLVLTEDVLLHFVNMSDYSAKFMIALKHLHDDKKTDFDLVAFFLKQFGNKWVTSPSLENWIRGFFAHFKVKPTDDLTLILASFLFMGDRFWDSDYAQTEWEKYGIEMTPEILARLLLCPHLCTGHILNWMDEFNTDEEASAIYEAVLEAAMEDPRAGKSISFLVGGKRVSKDQLKKVVMRQKINVKNLSSQSGHTVDTPLGTTSQHLLLDPLKACYDLSWAYATRENKNVKLVAAPALATPPTAPTANAIDTVACALFDIFINDLEVLNLLFEHGIKSADSFLVRAALNRGLPVTSVHLQIMAKGDKMSLHYNILEGLSDLPFCSSIDGFDLPAYAKEDRKPFDVFSTGLLDPALRRADSKRKRHSHVKKWRALLADLAESLQKETLAKRKRRNKGDPRILKNPVQASFEGYIKSLGVLEDSLQEAIDKKETKKNSAKKLKKPIIKEAKPIKRGS